MMFFMVLLYPPPKATPTEHLLRGYNRPYDKYSIAPPPVNFFGVEKRKKPSDFFLSSRLIVAQSVAEVNGSRKHCFGFVTDLYHRFYKYDIRIPKEKAA